MPASPNFSYRIRDEIDEVYTFSIKHKSLGYDEKMATVLVRYDDHSGATIIAHDPPGMQGFHVNYPIEDDSKREREHQMANELLSYAEGVLENYEIKTSSWKTNSGNRSLRDIYVNVEDDEVDQVLLNMYQFLHHARDEYLNFLHEYEPDELIEPTSTIDEKVQEIIGSAASVEIHSR